MKITASEVNKLRQATGAGMMDCKKALVEAEGDFDLAVENLRKKGPVGGDVGLLGGQKAPARQPRRNTEDASNFPEVKLISGK